MCLQTNRQAVLFYNYELHETGMQNLWKMIFELILSFLIDVNNNKKKIITI